MSSSDSRRPKRPTDKQGDVSGVVRLQRYLAQCGICSRRAAEELIRTGQVKVNGRVALLGQSVVPGIDKVVVEGKPLRAENKSIYLFYKPAGYITSLSDPHERKTIAKFLNGIPGRVFPVGRLDRDVTGLLILTNDGDYAQRMLHPSYKIERIYLARVAGEVAAAALRKLQTGVVIDGKKERALEARKMFPSGRTRKLVGEVGRGESLIEIVVGQGQKHFVKKILKAVGLPVLHLCRTEFGPFALSGLNEGDIVRAEFKDLAGAKAIAAKKKGREGGVPSRPQ